MKAWKISKITLLGLTLLLGTNSWAADKGSSNRGPLKVANPVTVNGTRLAMGDYQVRWEGVGPDVELNIFQSNRIVLTVPARLVELTNKTKDAAYETRKDEDGKMSLTAIYFAGKNYELQIEEPSPMTESTKGGNQQ